MGGNSYNATPCRSAVCYNSSSGLGRGRTTLWVAAIGRDVAVLRRKSVCVLAASGRPRNVALLLSESCRVPEACRVVAGDFSCGRRMIVVLRKVFALSYENRP